MDCLGPLSFVERTERRQIGSRLYVTSLSRPEPGRSEFRHLSLIGPNSRTRSAVETARLEPHDVGIPLLGPTSVFASFHALNARQSRVTSSNKKVAAPEPRAWPCVAPNASRFVHIAKPLRSQYAMRTRPTPSCSRQRYSRAGSSLSRSANSRTVSPDEACLSSTRRACSRVQRWRFVVLSSARRPRTDVRAATGARFWSGQ